MNTVIKGNRIVRNSDDYEYISRWSTTIEGDETIGELSTKLFILSLDIVSATTDIVFYDDHYSCCFGWLFFVGFLFFLVPLAHIIFILFNSIIAAFLNSGIIFPATEIACYHARRFASIIYLMYAKIWHGNKQRMFTVYSTRNEGVN